MTIKRVHGKFVLYSKDGSERLGTHDTEEQAQAQEAAINMSKARAAGHHLPKPKGKK